MSTLLIEIGCEELPYKVCESVVRQLEGAGDAPGLAGKLLAEARLLGDETPPARVLVSPRRIAVLVEHVPARQTAKVDDFRGPKAEIAFDAEGKLTKAGEGFARSRGAKAVDVRRAVVDGTEFAVVRVEAERADAASVLPGVVAGLITGLQIPRGMRWGARPAGEADYLRFSRPIRWIVCKLGGATVPGRFYGLQFGDVTQGHRVLGAPVVLDKAEHYEQHLEEQKVVASQHERRRAIVEGLDARAAEAGGSWSDPGGVLAEAVYLAESPSVARGVISGAHLRLPDPVLVTAMQSHQRYFPVRDGEGGLLPAFLYVSNADPAAAELITHGNERVLGGRLDDAEFAYDRDVAEGLDTMADRLRDVVFHEKLGSLADKAVRLQGLVAGLGAGTPADGAHPGGNGSAMLREEVLRSAARLAKADLVSQVVIEFPVLQGEMGGLYAVTGGFGEAVAKAVGEHYWPLSATAPLPGTLPGALLAVADKVDNIAGAWVAGQKPSGSRDPYGLRRAAMGIVRIALEYALRFPLAGLLAVGARPVRGARHRGAGRRAPRRHRRRDHGLRARAPAGPAARGGPAVRERRGGARGPGRRPAGAGGAGARLHRARRARLLRGRRDGLQPLRGPGRQGRGRGPSGRRRLAVRRGRRARAGGGLRRCARPAPRGARAPRARERDQRSGRPAAGRRQATSTKCSSWTTTLPYAATGWLSWPRSRP